MRVLLLELSLHLILVSQTLSEMSIEVTRVRYDEFMIPL